MTRRILLLLPVAMGLAGCGGREQVKRYPLQGEVKALDNDSKTATIAARKIDGWMDAMTMEYHVRPDAEFQKLHVGDRIEATVVVNDVAYYVTDIKVLPKS